MTLTRHLGRALELPPGQTLYSNPGCEAEGSLQQIGGHGVLYDINEFLTLMGRLPQDS